MSTIPKDEQSLQSVCRNAHWKLLQKFAEAEIALGERAEDLDEIPGTTFGAKLARLADDQIDKATRQRLTEARTLLAHAQITVRKSESDCLAYWRLSVGKNGLNTRTFSRASLDKWVKSVTADLEVLRKIA